MQKNLQIIYICMYMYTHSHIHIHCVYALCVYTLPLTHPLKKLWLWFVVSPLLYNIHTIKCINQMNIYICIHSGNHPWVNI